MTFKSALYQPTNEQRILRAPAVSRFDMSCAQAHCVGSKPICRVMQLKSS